MADSDKTGSELASLNFQELLSGLEAGAPGLHCAAKRRWSDDQSCWCEEGWPGVYRVGVERYIFRTRCGGFAMAAGGSLYLIWAGPKVRAR